MLVAQPKLAKLLEEAMEPRQIGTPSSKRKSVVLEQIDGLDLFHTQPPGVSHTPEEKRKSFEKDLAGEAGVDSASE